MDRGAGMGTSERGEGTGARFLLASLDEKSSTTSSLANASAAASPLPPGIGTAVDEYLYMTRELVRRIPSSIEGYPVVVVETGVIRPLQEK